MARPRSDPLDPRRAPLRSNPPDEFHQASNQSHDKQGSSSTPTSPQCSVPASARLTRAPSGSHEPYRVVLPPELIPSPIDLVGSMFGTGLHRSSSGVLDAPQQAKDRTKAQVEVASAPPDPKSHGNNPRPKEATGPQDDAPPKFSEVEFYKQLESDLLHKPKDNSKKGKDDLEGLRESQGGPVKPLSSQEFKQGMENSDVSSIETDEEVRLFRSSMCAGVKAQEDRLGRPKLDRFPLTGNPPGALKEVSDLDTHPAIAIESKDIMVDIAHSDDLFARKVDRPVRSFKEESEETLDCLIDALEAEDSKDSNPEVPTTRAGESSPLPPELFETNAKEGLDDAEVAARRKKYGWNRMKEQKQNHLIKFLSFFNGPVQWVMEVAVVLAGGLQDWIDFGIICGLLLLNAVVGFAQEYHAGNIVQKLKQSLALRAHVVRNGSIVEISSEEVVLGDIIHVEDGTIIAADGKMIGDGAYLQVDQSGITGESLAVDKHTEDPVFASSAVKRGTGSMIVTATGDHTSVGNTAALVNKAANTTGHFTQVLNSMARTLLIFVVFTLLVVWISSYYRSNPIVQILEFTLAITVIGVPVGLPVVVTTTMAVGASYLAKEKAIVQKLAAIESLAGVEILCTDKTGTLTRNKLTLGEPYVVPGMTAEHLMLVACLAANRKKGGIDPIDKVFLKGLRSYPWAKSQIPTYMTLGFFPFDPVSKKVTAFVKALDGERIICVKGAPMAVLKTVQKETTLCEHFISDYEAKVNEFAHRGFRALGVARKREGRPWEILGIMPCSDPPRIDTAKTVTEAQELGLSIKMLTGDSVAIARETASNLRLGTNIYNAERLGVTGAGSMPGSEINDFVEAADGFAEVYPEHKYSVVEILQRRGYLVAMTGDGVNDAASLKKADTGIAVEGSSDAARSAADIVFLAPGLSAIIDAIKISRQIFHRMYAYVVYRIALSIHLELFLGIWIVIKNETLDLRLIVLLAIFADIATLAIAYDNASYSQSPAKWNQPRLWGESIVLGCILAAGTWVLFGTMLLKGEDDGVVEGWGSQDAVLFLQVTLTQSWLILITRATGDDGVKLLWTPFPSKYLTGAVVSVNVTATLMTAFDAFGYSTSWLTIVRVWVFSFGVTCANALAYITMHRSPRFNNLMHGNGPRRIDRERSREDFGLNLQRMATQHERSN